MVKNTNSKKANSRKSAKAPSIGTDPNKPVRLYADGVFDMYHYAHARLFKQCKEMFPYVYLVIGVSRDEDVRKYKGEPVLTCAERAESVRYCKFVDEVIEGCPWVTSLEFMDERNLDFMCHDDLPYPADDMEDTYAHLKAAGRFLPTQRTDGISTSDIITRIVKNYDDYVRRNLKKGFSRKDMNVSLFRSTTIRLKGRVKAIKSKLSRIIKGKKSEREQLLSPSSEAKKEGIKDVINNWQSHSQEMVNKFVQSMGLGEEQQQPKRSTRSHP
jgi:choline-phosphate cytidylyltransferase